MENLFSRRLPLEQRYGSRLVFRQGNPLSLADLDLVSAGEGSGGVGCVVRGGGGGMCCCCLSQWQGGVRAS